MSLMSFSPLTPPDCSNLNMCTLLPVLPASKTTAYRTPSCGTAAFVASVLLALPSPAAASWCSSVMVCVFSVEGMDLGMRRRIKSRSPICLRSEFT